MNLEHGVQLDGQPDHASAIRTADMGPRTLEYAENIHAQIEAIYGRLGVSSVEDIQTLPPDKMRRSAPDVRKLGQLLAELRHVLADAKKVERGLDGVEHAKRSVAAAEEVAKKYRSDVSTQFWLYLGKADVAQVLGENPHAALKAAQKVAEREPAGRKNMQSLLAKAYLRAGDFDEAMSIAERAGVTGDAGYIDELVKAYVAHGRLDDAVGYACVVMGDGTVRNMPVGLAGDVYAALYVDGDADGEKRQELMAHQEDMFAVQSRAVRELVQGDKLDAALALAREVGADYGGLQCLEMVGSAMRRKKMDTTALGVEMFETVRVVLSDERLYDAAEEWVKLHKGKTPASLTYACSAVSYMAKGSAAAPYVRELAEWARADVSTKVWLVKRLGEVTVALAGSHGTAVALPYLQEMKEARERFIENDDTSSLEETDSVYAKALVKCDRLRDAEYLAQGDLVAAETRIAIYFAIIDRLDPDDAHDLAEIKRILREMGDLVPAVEGGSEREDIVARIGEAHAFIDDYEQTLHYATRITDLMDKERLMSYVISAAKDRRTAAEHLATFREAIDFATFRGVDADEVRLALESYMMLAVDVGLPNLMMDELAKEGAPFLPSGAVTRLLRHAVVKYKHAKKYLP